MTKKSEQKSLFILLGLFILVGSIYLFQGLDMKYLDFYLSRRVTKLIVVILVAYAIGHSCIIFQTITSNNILTPSVMGLDSLYMLIQTIVVFFFGSGTLAMMQGWQNFGISVIIMIGSSLLLFLLIFKEETKGVFFLVLSGMICGSLFSGLSTFMQVLLDPNEFSILEGKMFASFNTINESMIIVCAITYIFIYLLTARDFPKLDVILLGRENAINLGVPYRKMVFKTLIIVAILVSLSTVLVGPMSFLGIITASLSRKILKTYKHSYQIMGASLIGCIALVSGLFVVERVLNYNTTISVIVNFVGGLYFILLLLKERKI